MLSPKRYLILCTTLCLGEHGQSSPILNAGMDTTMSSFVTPIADGRPGVRLISTDICNQTTGACGALDIVNTTRNTSSRYLDQGKHTYIYPFIYSSIHPFICSLVHSFYGFPCRRTSYSVLYFRQHQQRQHHLLQVQRYHR